MKKEPVEEVIEKLRVATLGTEYEDNLYLVGGIVRDRLLNIHLSEDIDLVLEGSSADLAHFLHDKLKTTTPVIYPRFETAMVCLGNCQIEIVSARKESYVPESRKPFTEKGKLVDDIYRRDFTINTLLENLHTNEILDLTSSGIEDLNNRIIRTPLDPETTFIDDPLRMLRAIRFSARFGFEIEENTYTALTNNVSRLSIISFERIRDEFVKILMDKSAMDGFEKLRETKLLDVFAPEISAMYGVEQNIYHIYDVWTHSMKVLENMPISAGLVMRLSALLHDIGKPDTRSVDENGNVHFYEHQKVGADMAKKLLKKLKFSSNLADEVSHIIAMHLRVGEYDSQWTDAAVRRLIRDAGKDLENLILLTECDKNAANPDMPSVDIKALREHIEKVMKKLEGNNIASPLNGNEIKEIINCTEGKIVGEAKKFLEKQVIEGNIYPADKKTAAQALVEWYNMR
ncbi:MAG: HD domain-containing protein [Armatimonadota bacterium]